MADAAAVHVRPRGAPRRPRGGRPVRPLPHGRDRGRGTAGRGRAGPRARREPLRGRSRPGALHDDLPGGRRGPRRPRRVPPRGRAVPRGRERGERRPRRARARRAGRGLRRDGHRPGASTALVAVQGPRAEEIVAGLTDPADPAAVETVRDLRYYAAAPLVLRTDDGAVDALVARTGYTGRTASSCSCPRTAPPTCGAPCSPRVRRSASSRRDCPRATRCAWRRGCRCTGTSSTPRPRRTRRGSVAS